MCTVQTDKPHFVASVLKGALLRDRSLRSRLISPAVITRSGGLPIRFPARLACAIPARTLSRRRSRSNSATVERTPNTSRPDGVLVSRSCFTATRSTLRRCNSSEISSNCRRLLASRSRAQMQIAANRPRRTWRTIRPDPHEYSANRLLQTPFYAFSSFHFVLTPCSWGSIVSDN